MKMEEGLISKEGEERAVWGEGGGAATTNREESEKRG